VESRWFSLLLEHIHQSDALHLVRRDTTTALILEQGRGKMGA
jgi:hypothetical protein